MRLSSLLSAALLCSAACNAATDPRVQLAFTLNSKCSGVSTTPEGRIFLVHESSPQLTEYHNSTGTETAYPDAAIGYNASSPNSSDIATHFVKLNAQRIGPDGNLWVVDTGGSPAIMPWGPKVMVFNVTTNSIARIFPMGNVTKTESLLDDIRFGTLGSNRAYLTDAGVGALIVLDLVTGHAVRVLEGHRSVNAIFPRSNLGVLYTNADGLPTWINADDLEVSPDGEYLYYQPASGGLWRIETTYLNQALYNSSLATVLESFTQPWSFTPMTGGSAIDAYGSTYTSDLDRWSIDKIWPNGTRVTYVQDDRLSEVNAMWVSSDQKLWMPNTAETADGTYGIYTIDIGFGPSAIDHD